MRRLAVLLLCPLLFLAGCGGSGSKSPTAGVSAGQPAAGALPTVSGSYGDKPTLAFPSTAPPTTVQKKVLKDGTGAIVQKGDLLVADYLGQVWKGTTFDNSYDRKAPSAFPIGVGKVIPAWDETLVGVKDGSRVELVVPPDKGYGAQGNTQAGIKGTDTLVFVVDVVSSYGKSVGGDPKATRQHVPSGLPTVTGALGSRPKVVVPKGTKPPAKTVTVLLAKGTGAPVTKGGTVVVQYEAVTWAGKSAGSTWQDGTPFGVPVGNAQQPSPFDALAGVPIGSRVLVELPPNNPKTAATDSVAVVFDIVAEPGTAKAGTK